jgi:nicotinamide mononucleotide transporter
MASFTDAAVPYWDAFTTVASLVAQWLLTRKKVESWVFWIAVDLVAIGVYIYKSLLLTAGLYTLFLIMATMGFMAWQQSFRTTTQEAISDDNRLDAGEIRAAP